MKYLRALTVTNLLLILHPKSESGFMRRISLFIVLSLPLILFGQIACVVTPADTLICFKDTLAFETEVTGTGPFTYQWQKNRVNIAEATDSILAFAEVMESDTGYYRCIVSNGATTDTSNEAYLHMYPAMQFDTLYRYNALGCRGDCKGQFKALVSGGTPPYYYQWGGGYSQDTIVFGLCMGNYTLKVFDFNGCHIDSAYYVDVLKSPGISFISYQKSYNEPQDTFYLTNPNVTVEFPFEYRDSLINWEWDFADGTTVPDLNPVTHAYTRTGEYTILLTITDLNGCDTTVSHIISVKTAQLNIPYAFTPNNDGYNDTFVIEVEGNAMMPFQDIYLSNELIVYDRWGKKVYNKENYSISYSTNIAVGDWDGNNLSDGVYYYILKCQGQYEEEVFRGAVHILGKGE